jgi:nuclear transport factor 2 (NTF2) superfamily protein
MLATRPFGVTTVSPFTVDTALSKVQVIEDAFNTCDPYRISMACTPTCLWRNKTVDMVGRGEIVEFLTAKRYREIDFALRMALWSVRGNRIAVRVQCEYGDAAGRLWRGYGVEMWEFADDGLISRREACMNEVSFEKCERRIRGRRPAADRGADLPLD